MGELFDYFKQRYFKSSSETEDIMRRTKVKNALVVMQEELLKEGDVLTFEVLPRDLEHVLVVVGEDPLKSSVIVNQIAPSLFEMKLIEVSI